MKIRIASLLFALALPLAAQEPVAAETEAMFYKAFYLEKGQRDFAGAMTLYEQFLAKAPEHKLAAEAAKQQFNLLSATGKTKERDAFKASILVRLFDDPHREGAMPRPFGVFHVSDRHTHETKLNAQVALAKEKKGPGDLDTLLRGEHTWTIG